MLARAFVRLQIGVSALLALLASVAPLMGSAGRQIAFESDRDGNWEIYLMDVERRLAVNVTRSPDDERAPSWTSDGRALAFYSSYDSGRRGDIFVLELSDGHVWQLIDGGDNNWMPSWSPDGQYLVYLVNYGGIVVADADGSRARRIGYGFRPSWSPDSQRIIYYADRQETLNADVYDMDIHSLSVRNLSRSQAHDFDPAWSPDGKWIAFVSSRGANAAIYIMPACEDARLSDCALAAHPITHNRVADIAPAWSPDGKWIAFTSKNEGFDGIFIMDADGGSLQSVTAPGSNNRLAVWRPQVAGR
jgi:TolB protein